MCADVAAKPSETNQSMSKLNQQWEDEGYLWKQ
jgi:hypothetical protein